MKQIIHIQKNKEQLILRFEIIRFIREFFWSKKFLEVETPLILRLPGQEPYLSPMSVGVKNERGKPFQGYLHTSPEYGMKKMLAAGFTNIFSICKCFRDKESFGGMHNPEFTMIEWYRVGSSMWELMDDVEELFGFVELGIKDLRFKIKDSEGYSKSWKRVSMKEIWIETLGLDLDLLLTDDALRSICLEKGYNLDEDERYEDLFFRIFLNEIEPKLAKMGNVIIYNYPAQMAALAKISEEDLRYAERFEVYINGIEIANAFSELTDEKEQLDRLEEERDLRKKLGKEVYAVDTEFIDAVKNMPKSAGIALGVDRMVMVLLGCQEIDDVICLPISKIFEI